MKYFHFESLKGGRIRCFRSPNILEDLFQGANIQQKTTVRSMLIIREQQYVSIKINSRGLLTDS